MNKRMASRQPALPSLWCRRCVCSKGSQHERTRVASPGLGLPSQILKIPPKAGSISPRALHLPCLVILGAEHHAQGMCAPCILGVGDWGKRAECLSGGPGGRCVPHCQGRDGVGEELESLAIVALLVTLRPQFLLLSDCLCTVMKWNHCGTIVNRTMGK